MRCCFQVMCQCPPAIVLCLDEQIGRILHRLPAVICGTIVRSFQYSISHRMAIALASYVGLADSQEVVRCLGRCAQETRGVDSSNSVFESGMKERFFLNKPC